MTAKTHIGAKCPCVSMAQRTAARSMPSHVSFTADERVIGNATKKHIAMNITIAVFCGKRLIVSRFSDPVVREDMTH